MKSLIITLAMLLAGIGAWAQITNNAMEVVSDVAVNNVAMKHSGEYFVVDMDIQLSDLDVNSNRAVLLTPYLVNQTDTLELPSVGVYGRTRYYYYVRNGESMLTANEVSYRASERPETIDYHQILSFQDWMNGATLVIARKDYGCCSSLLAQESGELGFFEEFTDFFPTLVYRTVSGEGTKERSVAGEAFIDFRVNKTNIDPEYRNNVAELGVIRNTIDSLNVDGDITIRQVWLKGYASPESPYSHNRTLAIGRTNSLKAYIGQLYHFPDTVIVTDYEPENWVGLREFVETSNLEHRAEILDIIASDLDLDVKERRIKSRYPADYRILLTDCYPALRRTDYKISYNVKTYVDVEDIKRVMAVAPQNLSLNEFYLLAEEYESGSPEFSNVFETAVRMYPNDTIANLNAANAAMRRNDLASVPAYLDRAGNSPEVTYARAAYQFRCGNYEAALPLFQQALDQGVEEAATVLEQFERRVRYYNKQQ